MNELLDLLAEERPEFLKAISLAQDLSQDMQIIPSFSLVKVGAGYAMIGTVKFLYDGECVVLDVSPQKLTPQQQLAIVRGAADSIFFEEGRLTNLCRSALQRKVRRGLTSRACK